MKLERVRAIADAVLNEGYILYPYRPTATKNRSRWTFGGVYPHAWFESTHGADPFELRTEFLLHGGENTQIEACLRFLQPLSREVGRLDAPLLEWRQGTVPAYTPVPMLSIDEKPYYTWQEAVERELLFDALSLVELARRPAVLPFACPELHERSPLSDSAGVIRGLLTRRQRAQRGNLHLSAQALTHDVWRLSARVENSTPMDPAMVSTREEANLYSFASTHLVLAVAGGAFVSQQDPPDSLSDANAACKNHGLYPVLAGETGSRDLMLAAPIILYDHPEVAPQSPGDFCDATEIDELLSLTILALTDDEKREMAAGDPRAAALLERTERLSPDDFQRLHGTLRRTPIAAAPRLVSLERGGRRLCVGDRVVLKPHPRGDVFDLVLANKTAIIESIERDFEDRVHVAVTIDADPGRAWGLERMPGHRFFFAPEEIEADEEPRMQA
jgi:hypothetical protein